MNSTAMDTSRRQSKAPLAPPTKGLKNLMHKLGTLNPRHDALVKRVDELEVIRDGDDGTCPNVMVARATEYFYVCYGPSLELC